MASSQPVSFTAPAAIPATLTIGVTGHRQLGDEAALAAAVRAALAVIRWRLPHTPLTFRILSPLAEGADRLVAREVLQTRDAELTAVLPLTEEDYRNDFAAAASKAEFETLLARAKEVITLPPVATRTEAYAQVGRYIVDHCDVLIALWNGQPAAGQGGTAEIVAYARQQGRPLFWIPTDGDQATRAEWGHGLSACLQALNQYNGEAAEPRLIEQEAAAHYQSLSSQAAGAGSPLASLQAAWAELLPAYARADHLALRYQRRYFRAGSLIYALAAAVAVAACQALFLHEWVEFIFIEVGLMLVVLSVIGLGRRQQWHIRWIDYRLLAERFRAAPFLALANATMTRPCPPAHLNLCDEWIAAAFTSVWNRLPPRQTPAPSLLDSMRAFFFAAWIDDQIDYYRRRRRQHEQRYHRLAYIGDGLFGVTLIAAALHAFKVAPAALHGLLTFITIACPAAGGALGAIRHHREYLRNARRYEEMVNHLEALKARMTAAPDMKSFLALTCEAYETMLHENEDWRVLAWSPGPEPPA